MPTLNWLGKDKIVTHINKIPFHVLEHKYKFSAKSGTLFDDESEKASGNKIIHGDNLIALKSLLLEYENKIKCIYIDPPYNTGNENWVYNDNVNDPRFKKWLGEVVGKEGEDLTRHDKWLCMMYPRLQLLKRLLSDDGAIFISIDDNEQANLKLICDEIFGVRNFISNIIWEKKYSPQNDAKYLSDSHDFIIAYAKDKELWRPNLLPRTAEMDARYKNPDNDPRGVWTSDNLLRKDVQQSGLFIITTPSGRKCTPSAGASWRVSQEKFAEMVADNRIWFGEDGNNVPRIKRFLSEVQQGSVSKTIWKRDEVGDNQDAKREVKKFELPEVFDTPKPTQLIQKILQLATNPDSIILDSFAGSGTTAHAVLNLNQQDGGKRKFILIELEDYAESITAERVKRVMQGYSNVDGTGGSFDFYEVGEPIMIDNMLNKNLQLEDIYKYIWFSETRTQYKQQEHKYYLGEHDGTAIYFYYEPEQVTCLDFEFLSKYIFARAERYIIYANTCALGDEFMRKYFIEFKKIPSDIMKTWSDD